MPYRFDKMARHIIISSRDIALIYGLPLFRARRIMRDIRAHIGKCPGTCLTLREFCRHEGLWPHEVLRHLQNMHDMEG